MHQITALIGLKRHKKPLIPMDKPAFAAHLSNVQFTYYNNKYDEFVANLGT